VQDVLARRDGRVRALRGARARAAGQHERGDQSRRGQRRSSDREAAAPARRAVHLAPCRVTQILTEAIEDGQVVQAHDGISSVDSVRLRPRSARDTRARAASSVMARRRATSQ
jgi:hypothetical protein